MTFKIKTGDMVFLPNQVGDRFLPGTAGYVHRVFTAPAVFNPFNRSSPPLRPDTPCAEILFGRPARSVIVDLTSNSLIRIKDPTTGKDLTLYVGIHDQETPKASVPDHRRMAKTASSAALAPDQVVEAYRRGFGTKLTQLWNSGIPPIVQGFDLGRPEPEVKDFIASRFEDVK